MKRYIQGKLYLQISDIFYLIKHRTILSPNMFAKLITFSFNLNENFDRTEFVCFDDKDNSGKDNYICLYKDDILYLNALPCIVDYDSYKDYSIEDITNEYNSLSCKTKQLELKYNNLPNGAIKSALNAKHDAAVHKLNDLKILKLFKKGLIKLDIPERNNKIRCIYKKKDN